MKKPPDMMRARMELYRDIDSGALSLSESVKRMRRLIGKNQQEFSAFVGVGLDILRQIEQERGNPTKETLEKIGKPYGLRVGFCRSKGG